MVQYYIQVEHRKPDIIVVGKKKICKIIVAACPGDHRPIFGLEVTDSKNVGYQNYHSSRGNSALGSIPKDIHKFLKLIDMI